MKKLPLVGRLIYDTPWAIRPEMLGEIGRIYERHIEGEPVDTAAIEAAIGGPLARQRTEEPYDLVDGVAVIPIEGVIAKRMDMFMQVSGGVSVEQISAAFKAALADPACKAILFKVDSPGGAVDGIFELAQSIFEARGIKPVSTLAYGLMASAAYLIGAAAGSVYASDVATTVGSIGIVAAHKDTSKQDAATGVKTTEIYRGKYKRMIGEGPLSKEGRELLEGRVDYFYGLFVNAVATFRGVPAETVLATMSTDVMDLFIGEQAVAAGLVDGIATLDQLVGTVVQTGGRGTTDDVRKDIFSGGAMINASLTHNSTIADSEPVWGPYLEANRSKLPDDAFADPKDRSFPHHWVKSPGPVDKDTGRYSSGDLYLHVGGWRAANAAAHGARSGKKASSGVIEHLNGHRPAVERFDKSKEKSKKEAAHMDDTIVTAVQLRETFPALAAEIEKLAANTAASAERTRILGLAEIQFGSVAGGKFRAIVDTGATIEQFRAIRAISGDASEKCGHTFASDPCNASVTQACDGTRATCGDPAHFDPDAKARASAAAGTETRTREQLLAAINGAGSFNVGMGGAEGTANISFQDLTTQYRFMHKCSAGQALADCMKLYPAQHEAYLQAANANRGGK